MHASVLPSPPRGLLALLLAIALSACAQASAQDAPRAPAVITPQAWSDWEAENNHDFQCGNHQILVGRHHEEDENGRTEYRCANAQQFGRVDIRDIHVWGRYSESDDRRIVCPDGEVMTGRGHKKDENGESWYYCGKPYDYWDAPMQVGPDAKWLRVENESESGRVECKDNRVMIGRWHEGDENQPTEYLCAQLF